MPERELPEREIHQLRQIIGGAQAGHLANDGLDGATAKIFLPVAGKTRTAATPGDYAWVF